MRIETLEDPWLLPSRQSDLPGRAIIPESRLHGRREKTFLVLSALFIMTTAASLIFGTSRVIDVDYALATVLPDLALPIPLELPFGVLALPLAFLAINLVCTLFGRHRANAVLVVGLIVSLPLVGLMYFADVLDGGSAALGSALALAGYYVIAQPSNVIIFDALGARGPLRQSLSVLLAQLGGWAAFAFISYGYASQFGAEGSVVDSIASIVVASAVFVGLIAVVSALPFAIIASVLRTYLRVEAVADEEIEEVVLEEPAWRAARAAPAPRRLQPAMLVEDGRFGKPTAPFTSSEMRFFKEGEEAPENTETLGLAHSS